jgi:hypothetical protein
MIVMPRMSSVVRIYGPAYGSRLEQAPPDVDEMAGRHGVCPYTGVRSSGADPGGSTMRFPSHLATNVNNPKVN